MVTWRDHWKRWSNCFWLDDDLKKQLKQIEKDEKELEDCFYKWMEFGTGGMRGKLGPGTNRMNTFTIRRAAEGLARYVEDYGEEAKQRGVVIAYDSRHQSYHFAMETALTLGAHDIQVYVFQELRPTPELSFAVRHLQAFAGVMITASHNPPEYNGFKVYGEDGGQFPPEPAQELMNKVVEVEDELSIQVADENTMKAKRQLMMIGEEVDKAYNEKLQTVSLHPKLLQSKGEQITIVFTPLHGTANFPVTRALETSGFKNVHVVQEQALPDPNFSTVKSPNPESKEAFTYAIAEGKRVDADILMATDPDADRLGLAVKNEHGEYELLTGNQTAALMLDYLLKERKAQQLLPKNGVMLTTIVSSELGRKIANHYGVTTVDTLTGFKFIGEKMKEYEKTGQYEFQFGFEESYGYLVKDFVRDKDGVQAALLCAEMALWYKEKENKTLYEALHTLYERFGYYREGLESLTLPGKDGLEQMENIITAFRKNPPSMIGDEEITIREDYFMSERFIVSNEQKETIKLPVSNVLKYKTEEETWFCIRPSGTEPKIKFYFGVKGSTNEEAKEKLIFVKESVMQQVKKWL